MAEGARVCRALFVLCILLTVHPAAALVGRHLLQHALAAVFHTAAPLTNLYITDAAALPCSKPALWASPRTLADATWSTQQLSSGAVRLSIQHAPIQNVTANMMVWLFSNMGRSVADPRTGQRHQV